MKKKFSDFFYKKVIFGPKGPNFGTKRLKGPILYRKSTNYLEIKNFIDLYSERSI
jgi:hypothetical protein